MSPARGPSYRARTELSKRLGKTSLHANCRYEQRSNSDPEKGHALVDGHYHYMTFVAAQTRDMSCCEELWQLPANRMNGRHQPNQHS